MNLTEQEEHDTPYTDACQIAMYMYDNFYKEAGSEFHLLEDLRGVLSQIDNMTTGLQRKAD